MKFNNIDKDINADQIEAANKRLAWLFTELGCSKTNEHVGTGLGGNESQLFVLLDFTHTLARSDNSIQLDGQNIIWGAD